MMTQFRTSFRDCLGVMVETLAREVFQGGQIIRVVLVTTIQEAQVAIILKTPEAEDRMDSPTSPAFLALEMAEAQIIILAITTQGIVEVGMEGRMDFLDFQTSLASWALETVVVQIIIREIIIQETAIQETVTQETIIQEITTQETITQVTMGAMEVQTTENGLPILHSSNFSEAKERIQLMVPNS